MVVEAAPDWRGADADVKVGRIIELVLLSVNLGIETDDDDVEEVRRLPAVCIDDEDGTGADELLTILVLLDLLDEVVGREESPATLVSDRVGAGGTLCVGVSVTGSRSDAGPVKVLVGDEAIRRDDAVGVSIGVDEGEDVNEEEDVDDSMLLEVVVNVLRGTSIEELDLDDIVPAAELAVEESLDNVRLDAGVVKVRSGVDPADGETDKLDEMRVFEVVANVSEVTDDEVVEGSILVLGVVKVDNGTPVSSPTLEVDPSTGIIVTAGDPAAAPPIPTELVVGIGVDVFENVKLRARLW
ncbi:hypothetical protein ACEPPN_007596 [Leptodophora sp. 'Broadleaf-Isolate-01']